MGYLLVWLPMCGIVVALLVACRADKHIAVEQQHWKETEHNY